ncbi:MAG TPA: SMP-30/gluconolactonase/LRE family protein [Chitinophagaceae bacterium]|nr:SMP-30/gluconolactonase/LRE family protein [Chitinophagaceae bacterium]
MKSKFTSTVLAAVLLAATAFFLPGKVLVAAPGNRGQQTGDDTVIVVPGATPHLVSRQFIFTEGPAVDKAGNIFFTDQPNNQIWEYSIDGNLSLYMDNTRRSNGMYFDAKGNLVSCADEHDELVSISPSKKITVLADNYNGHTLNGPNDVWVAPNGAIYISDPYFQRDYWLRKKPDPALPGEKVYYLAPHAKQLVMADSSVKKPNGIVGTPDGKYLYVADMGDWKTYRYDINADGSLTNKTLFANEASDGMTLDERGNVYFTNNGVQVYSPQGKKIKHIDIPEKWCGNICFGGKDRKLLFVTASEGIYTLPMLVKGVE